MYQAINICSDGEKGAGENCIEFRLEVYLLLQGLFAIKLYQDKRLPESCTGAILSSINSTKWRFQSIYTGEESLMYKRVVLERSVAIPMRDGTLTYADIFRPDTADRVPAILSRTPYSKESLLNHSLTIDAFRAAEHGYAVVFQDTRGRWSSQGEFYPFRDEILDGYDSVEWLAARSEEHTSELQSRRD